MTEQPIPHKTKSDKARRVMFKAYPACRYKAGHKPIIVHNKAEDEMAISDGWAKTPVKNVLDELPPEITDNAEVVEKIETAVASVAAITNMLTRINKVRSKKDLRWLAAELAIEIPGDGYSLKELRKIILDEARIHPDFAKLFKDSKQSSNSDSEGQVYEHGATTH